MSISELREDIKKYVDEKRLDHVFGTELEIISLAEIFELDGEKKHKLACAALLHDITKKLAASEHIELMKTLGKEIPEVYLDSPKTLHSYTGAFFAKENFPEYTPHEVFCAIMYHTTGKADMTLEQKLMYLADFIEPTRTFDDCRELRRYFYEMLKTEDKYTALDKSLIYSFEMTVSSLKENGEPIHPDTNAALEYLKNNSERIQNTMEEKIMEEKTFSPKELAEKIVTILDKHKAGEIKLLHTEEKTTLADYFIICGGNSTTQTKGLSDEVEYKLGLEGIAPLRVEGFDSGTWVLMDYNSVLVHILSNEARSFYNLEKLWREAEEVDISALLTED